MIRTIAFIIQVLGLALLFYFSDKLKSTFGGPVTLVIALVYLSVLAIISKYLIKKFAKGTKSER